MQLSQQNQELTEKLKTRRKKITHLTSVLYNCFRHRAGVVPYKSHKGFLRLNRKQKSFASRCSVGTSEKQREMLYWASGGRVSQCPSECCCLRREENTHENIFSCDDLKAGVGGWTPLLWVIRPLKGSYWTQAQRVGAHSTLSLYSRNCRSSFLFVFFYWL